MYNRFFFTTPNVDMNNSSNARGYEDLVKSNGNLFYADSQTNFESKFSTALDDRNHSNFPNNNFDTVSKQDLQGNALERYSGGTESNDYAHNTRISRNHTVFGGNTKTPSQSSASSVRSANSVQIDSTDASRTHGGSRINRLPQQHASRQSSSHHSNGSDSNRSRGHKNSNRNFQSIIESDLLSYGYSERDMSNLHSKLSCQYCHKNFSNPFDFRAHILKCGNSRNTTGSTQTTSSVSGASVSTTAANYTPATTAFRPMSEQPANNPLVNTTNDNLFLSRYSKVLRASDSFTSAILNRSHSFNENLLFPDEASRDDYYCSDCKQYFSIFDLYFRHLEETGHQNHKPDKKDKDKDKDKALSELRSNNNVNRSNPSTESYIPRQALTLNLSNNSRSVTSVSESLTDEHLNNDRSQFSGSNFGTIDGNRPARTHDDRLPSQVTNNSRGILYFGASVRPHSLIGGASWWIASESNKIVTYGSIYVHQTFPSLIRLEYEALLNGLRAVCLNNFGRVTITGSSRFVLTHLSQRFETKFPFMRSVHVQVDDVVEALKKVLFKLQHFEAELISKDANNYANTLAEKAIVKYEKRKFAVISKLFAESQFVKAVNFQEVHHVEVEKVLTPRQAFRGFEF